MHILKRKALMETKMLSFSLKNDKSELDTLCQKLEIYISINYLDLNLVKKVMDQVCYERYEGKNKLTLKKAIERN